MTTPSSQIDNKFHINNFGEHYLPSVNRKSFERLDSKTVFKQTFKDQLFVEDCLHIIIGSDSGLLIDFIINSGMSSGSKYLIVEPKVVLDILPPEILNKVPEQIKLIDIAELESLLSSDFCEMYLIKNQYMTHNSIASTLGVVEQYNTCIHNVQKQLKMHRFKMNCTFQNKVFLIQQLKNTPDNLYPASLLRNKFIGKTCIIIGGGPSLDEHIDWITQNYDQLFIITVSRVAAKLSKANIPAHIIVSIDYQEHNFEVNIDAMALAQESLLINSYHLNHRITSQWQGKSLYTGPRLPWSKDDANNIASAGPTVTNSALRIAIELGFRTILLSGVDFCYSSSGATHSKGSVEAEAGINNSRIEEWVETYAGNLAETPVQLISAAQTLQTEALSHPKVNIINLSINAAKLEGIRYQAAETITLEPASITPKQLLDMMPSSAEDRKSHYHNMQEELLSSEERLNVIKTLSEQAIKLNQQLKKINAHSKPYRSITKKIALIEKEIESKYSDYSYLIKQYGYVEFSKFLTTKESADWTVEEMQNMTHLYYNAFVLLASEINDYIAEAKKLIETRQLELCSSPDLNKLTKLWLRHNQPGRVHILSKLREELGLNIDSASVHLTEARDEYHRQLTEKSHPYFSMKQTNSSLHNTLAKITDLYKSKNQTGLTQLANNIEPMIKGDLLAQRLYFLAKCYLYILDNNKSAALLALQQIDEHNQTEVTLKQLVALASEQQQIELTLSALAKLVNFSHEYLPLYAHALTIQGDNIAAINTYLDYLEISPEDIKVRLNLGAFLLKIGQTEGAITCFKQVLTLDIDNLSALNYLNQVPQ
ncbi:6-hydroxymethylpterin diphosphokinase MptE-like protein [Shewanella halifaxensis]|uniref:6-hydroxymethylpterin diphosphokinase MptE-like protein n=1 Tax=Shewanella halifaxensis TaxID=271098 RepID=UPI000D5A0D54|nr:6-hydroxymethylpterin diphosphokinase MptE-like protein [Shewanella halifaxensis]